MDTAWTPPGVAARPAYDLTQPGQALAFLGEARHTRFVPSGSGMHQLQRLINIHDLTNPRRSADSHQPSGDQALAALTLLAVLRDWLAEAEPDLIEAAGAAGVTWAQLAPVLRVGDCPREETPNLSGAPAAREC
ncbi:hypothetical protein [Nonomuraea endophytica]|uniref:Uncharacterized protein n=1 Tax=Nonomuraea endophytica TaxID=714136 RepID=A0A7W8AAY6_9ACTN|nr:hypothetical protein [Nonomuraea endophytica]MBB5081468.1 hypothetical protein [Nonomuraea endophytica]